MIAIAATNESGVPLMLVEGSLTAITSAVAFALPRLGSSPFKQVETAFTHLARRKHLSVVLVGLSALVLRLAILPLCSIPLPFVQDDFSFLLAAKTFAMGRLTNPTPALWTHFESIQITMVPTYMSMYFPAQGLILAAGQVFFGHPWFGLLIVNALMCTALCWMLQAWLPPQWALLGGVVAILRIALFSYWINTYSGAGSIAALGGALLLGALPRFLRRPRLQYSLIMALGVAILALSRPYEGVWLCIPVGFVLVRWTVRGPHRPSFGKLSRVALPALAVVLAAVVWLGYYDKQAFGNPLTPPYTLDREQYAAAPYYVWQSPKPIPTYRHKSIRDFYIDVELKSAQRLHTVRGFLTDTFVVKPLRIVLFFAGLALLPSLFALRRAATDRKIRFLTVCAMLVTCAVLVETWLIPHYVAAITAALYAIGLQCMRHLRLWKPGGQPVGIAMQRLSIVLCILLAGLRLFAQPLHLELAQWPGSSWTATWHGPGRLGLARKSIEDRLNREAGNQFVLVRYAPDHNSLDEWVYNEPDLEHAKIIWAHEMDSASDRELLDHYTNHKVWIVEPDKNPVALTPCVPSR